MKNILITGGSKGIGFELVKRFCQAGYHVITCGRNKDNWLKQCALYPYIKSVDFQEIDLSLSTELKQLFIHIKDNYAGLHLAINNASPKVESTGCFKDQIIENLHHTLTADFWVHAQCLKYELNLMSRGASIVNISSINGLRPTENAAMYSASKHAIEGLTRSLALEAIKDGIRINAVAPGTTWTPRWQAREIENPQIKSQVEKMIPMGRFATTTDIANAVEWLCSSQASYIIGHTLVVDGGLSLK